MMRHPLLEQDPVLREMVDGLVHALHPERIYLFGSRARGDAGPDSDYDLLAVVPKSDLAPHRQDVLAFRALCRVGAGEVMIPTENKRDFADLPADIIDKLQIVFYSDPTNAAFRAMGLE